MKKFNHLTMSTGHNLVQRKSMVPNLGSILPIVVPHLRAALGGDTPPRAGVS